VDIQNNIFRDLRAWATVVKNDISGVRFVNNLIYNMSIHGFGCRNSAKCIIRNNIFYNAGSNYIVTDTAVIEASNNLIFHASGTIDGGRHPNDLVNIDPLLIAPPNPDGEFSLSPSSPAIDAGMMVEGCDRDRHGSVRPQGTAWDIGPYESRKLLAPSELGAR
jgi:hypothetical protein